MNECDELYQKGDMVWIDPDGREWVPAHEYAKLKRENEKVRRLYARIKAADHPLLKLPVDMTIAMAEMTALLTEQEPE